MYGLLREKHNLEFILEAHKATCKLEPVELFNLSAAKANTRSTVYCPTPQIQNHHQPISIQDHQQQHVKHRGLPVIKQPQVIQAMPLHQQAMVNSLPLQPQQVLQAVSLQQPQVVQALPVPQQQVLQVSQNQQNAMILPQNQIQFLPQLQIQIPAQQPVQQQPVFTQQQQPVVKQEQKTLLDMSTNSVVVKSEQGSSCALNIKTEAISPVDVKPNLRIPDDFPFEEDTLSDPEYFSNVMGSKLKEGVDDGAESALSFLANIVTAETEKEAALLPPVLSSSNQAALDALQGPQSNCYLSNAGYQLPLAATVGVNTEQQAKSATISQVEESDTLWKEGPQQAFNWLY